MGARKPCNYCEVINVVIGNLRYLIARTRYVILCYAMTLRLLAQALGKFT